MAIIRTYRNLSPQDSLCRAFTVKCQLLVRVRRPIHLVSATDNVVDNKFETVNYL